MRFVAPCLLLLLIVCFAYAQKSGCSQTALNSLLAQANTKLSVFDNIYGNVNADQEAARVIEEFLTFPAMNACTEQVTSFFNTTADETQTFVSSRCEAVPETVQFATDPCCNSTLGKEYVTKKIITLVQHLLCST